MTFGSHRSLRQNSYLSLLSLGYECFSPIRNTPDILDAVFGVIGVAIAYIFLILLRKNGLIAK